jgi:predicted nucleic-acid-binding Zn-ribbon protein
MKEWRCPKCKVNISGGFQVRSPAKDASDSCELLHTQDNVLCHACGYNKLGQEAAVDILEAKA